ncbi:MAG: hypothetical protein HYY96_01755 [Candidatus Tectomicrobia bacterium]|nr:hypothetical protein [Candidatus Tectomicrobia bacterium]
MHSRNDDLIANLESWRHLYRSLRSIFVPRSVAERITRLGHDYRLLLDQYMDSTDASVKAFCLSQLQTLSQAMRQLIEENREAFGELKLTIKEIETELPPSPPPRPGRRPPSSRAWR